MQTTESRIAQLGSICVALTAAAAASRADARGPKLDGQPSVAEPAEPPGQRVTLDELVAIALEHSPQLAIAAADRREASERMTAADAVDEWRVIARLDGQDARLDRSLASPSIALDTRQLTAEVGLARSLATGGEFTITASTGQVHYIYPAPGLRAQTALPDASIDGMTANARITVSQPLLRGAGASAARADQRIARLAASTQAAQADDEAATQIRDLVISYWELAYAVQTLAVDRDSELLAQHQLAVTRDGVRIGVQPPSALAVAQARVLSHGVTIVRDEEAILAQSLVVRGHVGLEWNTAPLIPSEPIELPATRCHQDEAIAATLAHGPQLAQKALAQRQADVAVDAAHDGRLPQLDLKLSGELDGLGASTAAAAGQLGDPQAYSVTASLSLRWDLGGAARAADRAARARRERLDAERAVLEHQLASAATSAVLRLRLAVRRSELAEQGARNAEEALRIEVAAFRNGRSTNGEVFQRDNEVAQLKLEIARARIDAIEACATLDYLTGRLLARHGATLQGRRVP